MQSGQSARLASGHARWALWQVTGAESISKTIGTSGESFFTFRALQEGLHVAQPIGDYLPYDLIVDFGQELLRIQVKSTTVPETDQPKYGFTLRSGSDGSSYHADTIDFFALVILPL